MLNVWFILTVFVSFQFDNIKRGMIHTSSKSAGTKEWQEKQYKNNCLCKRCKNLIKVQSQCAYIVHSFRLMWCNAAVYTDSSHAKNPSARTIITVNRSHPIDGTTDTLHGPVRSCLLPADCCVSGFHFIQIRNRMPRMCDRVRRHQKL
jgi:hypothetical protein